jgi:hypothetical protein
MTSPIFPLFVSRSPSTGYKGYVQRGLYGLLVQLAKKYYFARTKKTWEGRSFNLVNRVENHFKKVVLFFVGTEANVRTNLF